MWSDILLLIVGLVALVKSADMLVAGASAIAKNNNVSDITVGLTIVAFGTSAPELVVNVLAAYQDHQGIVFGNVIGSNNFNLFVILGVTALIAPVAVKSRTVWLEIPISFAATVLLLILVNGFLGAGILTLSKLDGFVLMTGFAGFMIYVSRQLKADTVSTEDSQRKSSSLKSWRFVVLGLFGLVLGGKLLVDHAVAIARDMGVSEQMIGLTIVAAGTSLPELATSVMAAVRGKNDIAIGNVIGSNIFNILFVLAVSAIIRSLDYNAQLNRDLVLLLIGTVILFAAMFIGRKMRLDRWQGMILLMIYSGYLYFSIRNA
ncbi:MAG: calcium/sodium antiporter [Flavobacteriales bacterium]|nr:calcium/sodium antiporter [Flavobacteriales bacterium]